MVFVQRILNRLETIIFFSFLALFVLFVLFLFCCCVFSLNLTDKDKLLFRRFSIPFVGRGWYSAAVVLVAVAFQGMLTLSYLRVVDVNSKPPKASSSDLGPMAYLPRATIRRISGSTPLSRSPCLGNR